MRPPTPKQIRLGVPHRRPLLLAENIDPDASLPPRGGRGARSTPPNCGPAASPACEHRLAATHAPTTALLRTRLGPLRPHKHCQPLQAASPRDNTRMRRAEPRRPHCPSGYDGTSPHEASTTSAASKLARRTLFPIIRERPPPPLSLESLGETFSSHTSAANRCRPRRLLGDTRMQRAGPR